MQFINMMMTMDPRLTLGSPGANMPTGLEAQDGEFADLLGLVSDLEIAERQDGGTETFVENALADMMSVENTGLEASKLQAQALLQTPITEVSAQAGLPLSTSLLSVGRQAEPQLASETRLAQDMSLEGLEVLKTKSQAMQGIPDSEAVEAWSLALASGDVTKVSLEGPSEAQQQGAQKARNEAAFSSSPLLMSKSEVAPETAPAQAKTLDALPIEVARDPQKTSAPEKSSGFEPFVRQERPEAAPRAEVSVAVSGVRSEAKSQNPGQGSEGRDSSEKRESAPKHAEVSAPVKAQDFMLEHTVDTSFASKAPEAVATSSVLRASEIGTTGDGRVPSQAVDFVADKVQALQAQGGGSLRLDMGSSELGQVTVKVTKRLGQMEVRIQADRPETARLFEASKQELVSKLESKVGPAQVSFDVGSSSATATAALSPAQAMARSTEQLLEIRQGLGQKTEAAPSMPHLREVASSKGAESQDMGSPDGWQREERREKALDQWEERVLHRRSA